MSENCVIELEKGNYKKFLCFREGCVLHWPGFVGILGPHLPSGLWVGQSTILSLKLSIYCIIEVPVNFYA